MQNKNCKNKQKSEENFLEAALNESHFAAAVTQQVHTRSSTFPARRRRRQGDEFGALLTRLSRANSSQRRQTILSFR